MTKVAVITGGSSGLGLEFARALGSQGFSVHILARSEERLATAIQDLQRQSITATGVRCDITDEEELKRAVEHIRQTSGGIDFLILNAGIVTCSLLQDYTSTTALRRDFETNGWGTILSTYLFLPLVRPSGRILLISSGFGLMGPAGYSVYAASKAAIINFAESLRRELLSRGISVHVACPGDLDTPQLHEEMKQQPAFMKGQGPRNAMCPGIAAGKILRSCARNQFFIIPSIDVLFLHLATKFLPRWLRDSIIDFLFPKP